MKNAREDAAFAPKTRAVVAIAVVLGAVAMAHLVERAINRKYNGDELQHAHAVYRVAQGDLPFRDFFEHHPPALYYASVPLYEIFARDPRTMTALRFLMLACVAATFAALFATAYRTTQSVALAGVAGIAFLWCTVVLDKGIEFRPDGPATALIAWAIYFQATSGDTRRRSIVAALFWGLALTFTPKALFAFAGATLFEIARNAFGRRNDASVPAPLSFASAQDKLTRFQTREIAVWFVAAAVPALPWAVGYALAEPRSIPDPWYAPEFVRALPGALPAMVDRLIFWNANWANTFSPFATFADVARENAALVLFSILGVALALRTFAQTRVAGPPLLFALVLACGGAGAFAVHVPYAQYWLLLVPAAALAATHAIHILVTRANLAFIARAYGIPDPPDDLESASPRIAQGRRGTGLLVGAALITSLGMGTLARPLQGPAESNANQRAAISFFVNEVDPAWPVMGAWTGWAAFNPTASYYHFLHLEVRKMLPLPVQRDGGLAALSRARLVIRDEEFDRLPREVIETLERDFVPFTGPIWASRDVVSRKRLEG
ncbi:hypothetical protein K8I61_20455 [bacterium]|nr:hypothetical protein [bacterium]